MTCRGCGGARGIGARRGSTCTACTCQRVTLPQRFLANGSNFCRGGPVPGRSSQGPTVGLWKYTLLDTSAPVTEMYSQCQTDQPFSRYRYGVYLYTKNTGVSLRDSNRDWGQSGNQLAIVKCTCSLSARPAISPENIHARRTPGTGVPRS